MNKTAFDLFDGLAYISKKKYDWYESLSEEGQKAASPFVMARWMTGTSDQAQLIRLNTFFNPCVFAGVADKSSLFKLLSASATGKNTRYSWLKGPGAKSKRMSLEVIKQYYDCSTREAITYKVSPEDLIEMAEEIGLEKEDLAKLKKEVDDGSEPIKKPSSKSPRASKSRST